MIDGISKRLDKSMAAQRELVQWLRLSDPAARRHRDGLSTEGMEIRGLAGWMVRHRVEPEDFMKAGYRRRAVDRTAGLGGGWFVITSRGQTVADLIKAGRRFERRGLVWRELGIAPHPMTRILEEEHERAQFSNRHNSGTIPRFVMRVGYLDNYPEPVSRRRPVEWFVYVSI